MKSLLYITYDGLCDPLGQSQIIPYLKGLSGRNIRINILSYEKNKINACDLIFKIKQELDEAGIEWRYQRYHNRPRAISTLFDISIGIWFGVSLYFKEGFDFVHCRGYLPASMGFFLRACLKIKFIFDMRGFWVDEKADAGFWHKGQLYYAIAKHFEKMMINSADALIVLTERAKDTLVDYFDVSVEKIGVIPTCADLLIFRPLNGEKKKRALQDKVVILYSGSIGTFYGFDDAIDFFKVFYDIQTNAFFLVLTNQKNEAEKILNGRGLPSHLYRVLSLSYKEVSEWVKEADASLIFYHRLLSSSGCCPTKLAESLACGVPVVINNEIGDCDTVISNENVGLIVNSFSREEYNNLAHNLLLLLKDRNSLRSRCRKTAEKFFSLDSGVEKYLRVYNNLV